MTKEDAEVLAERAGREMIAHREFIFHLQMVLPDLCSMVGALQLALRHPDVKTLTPTTYAGIRSLVDQLVGAIGHEGFIESAALLRLGNNPDRDVDASPPGLPRVRALAGTLPNDPLKLDELQGNIQRACGFGPGQSGGGTLASTAPGLVLSHKTALAVVEVVVSFLESVAMSDAIDKIEGIAPASSQ